MKLVQRVRTAVRRIRQKNTVTIAKWEEEPGSNITDAAAAEKTMNAGWQWIKMSLATELLEDFVGISLFIYIVTIPYLTFIQLVPTTIALGGR